MALVLAGYFSVRAVLAVRELEQGVAELQQVRATLGLSAGDWTPQQVRTASALQDKAMSRIAPASSQLQSNPLLEIADATPGLHDQAQAVLDLASASDNAGVATGDLVRIAARSPDPGPQAAQAGTSTQRLLTLLGGSQPLLTDARTRLDSSVHRLRADLGHPLLPPLASKVKEAVKELGPAQTTVDEAATIGRYLPAAMGMNGPQSYLLLFANPWEIRPAGGFFGTVAVITFNNGEPAGLQVIDEAQIAQPAGARVPVPPALAARLILPNNAMDMGDSGWDPDFRASAALAEQLYSAGTGRSVDGVIEVDPYAIAALLKDTGPVNVAPYGTFTSANFFSKLNTLVNVNASQTGGKSALTPITQAVMSRVLGSPSSLLPTLLATVESSAAERHVQLYFNNPTLAAAAHRADLDGAIAQPGISTDYLMVVDANVGGNKSDEFVSRQTQVKVEVRPNGLAEHEVTLTYNFPAGDTEPELKPDADQAYRDYVRFLVPETSTVQGFYDVTGDGQRSGSIEDISVEQGKRVIGTFFRLAPGQSIQLNLFYISPVGNAPHYRLFVQKQAGIPGRHLSVEVSDPGGIVRRTADGRRDQVVTASW